MKALRILSFLALVACNDPEAPTALTIEENGPLKHIVLLDLKEESSEADVLKVVETLYTLQEISEVIDLEVSQYIDTGDDRLLGGFDIMLYTEFKDLADLKSYSNNDFHLSVRQEILQYLKKAPQVIDSME